MVHPISSSTTYSITTSIHTNIPCSCLYFGRWTCGFVVIIVTYFVSCTSLCCRTSSCTYQTSTSTFYECTYATNKGETLFVKKGLKNLYWGKILKWKSHPLFFYLAPEASHYFFGTPNLCFFSFVLLGLGSSLGDTMLASS